MLHMNQIDQIKDLQRQGLGACEIATRLGIDRKTTAKYMKQEDFSVSREAQAPLPSKLDPWKPIIDQWLAEDLKMRFKQRHTAIRIHIRLQEEHPDEYDCSYPLVQRYVKQQKMARKELEGYLELVWSQCEAQADFGEAELIESDVRRKVKYLTLTFPFSNAGFTQCFNGETTECVAQGLKDIFNHVGGVPGRIVFDNATGVGRRVRDRVTLSQLFLRFKCHYGFAVSFCNPAAGHEKGNVENKIGYIRRNYFVPMPNVESLETWNRELLEKATQDHARQHYKKGVRIAELFDDERHALGLLPTRSFSVERFERVFTDGYGKFCVDGKHWYSSAPEYGNSEVTIGLKAHELVVYQRDGTPLCVHRRLYGDERSDSCDYRTSLETLMKKPGAWINSAFRAGVDDTVRVAMDELSKPDLRNVLKVVVKSSATFGFDVAMTSLEEAIARGRLDSYSLGAVASRVAFDGLYGIPSEGPDLGAYDRVFMHSTEVLS
jgi:Transposase and inactivated derivatives